MNKTPHRFRRGVCLLICLLLSLVAGKVTAQHQVGTIPSPKERGQDYYVSNPDRILSAGAVDSLNRLARVVDGKTSAELAVVVVDDFVGDDDFQFALDVFNTWGIGKTAANNGLLLFVSTEKRAYRFITGYGMEAVLPDALLNRIGETLLVPRFREGEYDEGVFAAMDAVKTVVLNPDAAADLQRRLARQNSFFARFFYENQASILSSVVVFALYYVLWKMASRAFNRIPMRSGRYRKNKSTGTYLFFSGLAFFICAFLSIFVIVFLGMPPSWLYSWSYLPLYVAVFFGLAIAIMYSGGLSLIRKTFKDAANRLRLTADFNKRMILPMLAAPPTWILLYMACQRRKADRQRLIPPPGDGWQRVDRDKQKDVSRYLDKGQRREESVGALFYEIWTRDAEGGIHPIAFQGKGYTKYGPCPSCGYRTFANRFLKVLKRPTVIDEGAGEWLQECSHCKHTLSHGKTVLERTRPVSTSSSGSRSSSSGGSSGSSGGSSSSGSWGGGSSGGGGVGGRW